MKQAIVKDKMQTYSTYGSWLEEHFPVEEKNYKQNKLPIENRTYNVLGQAPHEDLTDTLYLIQDIDTKQVYIIGEKGLKFVKEKKMKDKLKIKVWNYKNVVLYEVLEQDEDLRDEKEMFKASNGWEIWGCDYPYISPVYKSINIRGNDKMFDKYIDTSRMETIQEAEKLVEAVKQAVKEFNESQREILGKEEKEYLSAVIKPFRDRVQYIEKCKDVKEFIFIKLSDSGIPLPYFKAGTMYKGMELNKKYTLEELGL